MIVKIINKTFIENNINFFLYILIKIIKPIKKELNINEYFTKKFMLKINMLKIKNNLVFFSLKLLKCFKDIKKIMLLDNANNSCGFGELIKKIEIGVVIIIKKI